MKGQTLKNFSKHLGVSIESDSIIEGFSVDSRNIKSGELFFALKGERVDGADFLKTAKERGALAAVISMDFKGDEFGLPVIRVPNVLGTLQALAKEEMNRRGQRVIGVTGSVGKTTTKEFISTLLEKKFSVEKTPGNANSQIGAPLAILNLEGKAELFILEMGMEHSGNITGLVNIAAPEIAVITKIGHAHVENFEEGIEGVAKAKAEILAHPKTVLKVINVDCLQYAAVKEVSGKKVTYSSSKKAADYMLVQAADGFYIQYKDKKSPSFTLPFAETHLIENFVAASVVAKEMGVEWEEIFARAQELKPFKLRFEKVMRDGVLYVNDCYNANPESMRAAIHNFPKLNGRAIGVFGFMTGLGKLSKDCHRQIAEEAESCMDEILVFGKGAEGMVDVFLEKGKKAEFFTDLEKLKSSLFSMVKTGDAVLIKGSNVNQMWKILET